ncbi:MAG TPA: ABC transporter ATP-binding protein [Dongiaceae bacterium]|nr:ABC transporter ATP-binding protein [Dongiaceae bacterium]
MINVLDLEISFAGVPVLRGISFDVARGESYGLVGESGSGKSTILRAITGLAPAGEGLIVVDGQVLDPGPRRDLAFLRRLQMVFQDPYGSLHPRHTVDRVLRESLAIQEIADADARIVGILADVGLGPQFRYRYPHQLSGGQRQRVAIARALITDPEILLLDEPTSALDVSVQAEVLNLLDDLRRARNLTFILVSHNLPVVTHMCDRVGVIQNGLLVEELPAAALDRGTARHAYTRSLLASASGYRRPGRKGTEETAPVARAPHAHSPADARSPKPITVPAEEGRPVLSDFLNDALIFGRSLR